MPHVIVKLLRGRSEQQKARLAEQISKEVVAIANCGEESVSVAIEEINPEDWAETVYKPDILDKPEKLYKKPGYKPQTNPINTPRRSEAEPRWKFALRS